jgi:hypothetical protein
MSAAPSRIPPTRSSARLCKAQGAGLGAITAETGIPKTSLPGT